MDRKIDSKTVFSKVFDYLFMFVGVAICAVGVNLFFIPFRIHSGGISGIATILYYVFSKKVPLGVMIIVLNLPLFIIGLKVIGKRFMLRTTFSTLVYTVIIDTTSTWLSNVSASIVAENNSTTDMILFSLFGGCMMGIGLGMVFTRNACTGGSDLLAEILRKKGISLSMGTIMFFFDLFTIVLSYIVFKNLMLCLYSVIAIFTSMKLIDFILDGANIAKAVFIISEHSDKIAEAIMSELKRGVTGLSGRGMYLKMERETLFCVVKNRQLPALKKIVKTVDRKAFLIVTTAHEVLGEGFTTFDKEL